MKKVKFNTPGDKEWTKSEFPIDYEMEYEEEEERLLKQAEIMVMMILILLMVCVVLIGSWFVFKTAGIL